MASHSPWHVPNRGHGTPDFTTLALSLQQQHPHPHPRRPSSLAPGLGLITPAPRRAPHDGIELNTESPPLSLLEGNTQSLLPLWSRASPSSSGRASPQHDAPIDSEGVASASTWWNALSASLAGRRSATPGHGHGHARRKTAVLAQHARRRSEHDAVSVHARIHDEDDEDDEDDDKEQDDDLLLAPPRSASLPLWNGASVAGSPSPAPSSSSSSSSSTPAPAPCSPAAHHRTSLLGPGTPFASFFGLRARPPAAASPCQAASSPYQHSRQSASSHRHQHHPGPTSPTTSSSSALGSRFRWRRRQRSASEYDDALAQPSRSAPPRLDKDRITWAQRALPYLPALIVLAAIFLVSTTVVVIALSSLPVHLPPLSVAVPIPGKGNGNGTSTTPSLSATANSNSITYRLAHLTLADIRAVTTSLKEYARTGKASAAYASGREGIPSGQQAGPTASPLSLAFAKVHVLLVLSTLFVWKQAFTIPGSIIMNVIFGALYGTAWGTVYTSLLTALGGLCCYLLCAPLGGLIATLPGLRKPLLAIRNALDPDAAVVVDADADAGGAPGEEGCALSGASIVAEADTSADVEERSAMMTQDSTSSRPSLLHRTSSSFSLSSYPLSGSASGAGAAAFSSIASRARRVGFFHSRALFGGGGGAARTTTASSSLSGGGATRPTTTTTSAGSAQTWSYLLLLRLVPIVPYGLTNIACAVLRTPLVPFTLTLGLGSVPWNVLTCQVGELLEEVLSVALEVATASSASTGHELPVQGLGLGHGMEKAASVKATQGAAAGVRAILSQVLWKRETLVRLGLLTLASVAPVLLARLLRGGRSKSRAVSPVSGVARGREEGMAGEEAAEPLLLEEVPARTDSPKDLSHSRTTSAINDDSGNDGASAEQQQQRLPTPPPSRPWWLDDDEHQRSGATRAA